MKTSLARMTLVAAACASGNAGMAAPASPYNPNVSNCFAISLIAQSPGGAPHFTNPAFGYGNFAPTAFDATSDASSGINAYALYAWLKSYGIANPAYLGVSGLWARLELGTVQAPGDGSDNTAFTFQLRKDYLPPPIPRDATWRTGYFRSGARYQPRPGDFDLGPYENTSYNDYFQNTHNVCYANTYGQRCRVFFVPIDRATVNADDGLIERFFSGNYPLYRPPYDTLPADVSFVVTDPLSAGQGCQATFRLKPPPYVWDPNFPVVPTHPVVPVPGPPRPTLPGLPR